MNSVHLFIALIVCFVALCDARLSKLHNNPEEVSQEFKLRKERKLVDKFCETPISKGKVTFPDSIAGRANINFDMYSGYVNITTAPDYLFYWFHSAKDKNPDAPLIIW